MTEFDKTSTQAVPDAQGAGYEARRHGSAHAYPDGVRSASGLFTVLKYSFYIFIVAEVLITLSSVIFTLFPAVLAFDAAGANPQLAMLGMGLALSGILYIAAFVFSVVMTCRFTYRTMRNLHTVNSPVAEMSPGWAVGWYFIPIANLFKPAQGMSQIYHGTVEAAGERPVSRSPIPLWWSCWLITGILGNISGRIPEYNLLTLGLDLSSGITGIIAALSLLNICRKITERQELLKHGGVAEVFG